MTEIKGGDADAVKMLISNGADIRSCDDKGMFAIHLAVQAGYRECVEVLLNNGVNVDEVTKEIWRSGEGNISKKIKTALHIACEKGHQEIVGFLLERGADVNKEDEESSTPLHLAIGVGRRGWSGGNAIRDSEIVLFDIGSNGYIGVVSQLIQHSADVNIPHKNRDNMTALHLAVYGKHTEIVQLLLKNGARTDKRNDYKETPLAVALRLKRDVDRETPVDEASRLKLSEIVELLKLKV